MTRVRMTERITLDDLPLFASDRELACAIVGPERADAWVRDYLPKLEKIPGFPAFDETHGGRYTPAVRAYYDIRNGIGSPVPGRDQPEDIAGWRNKRRAS